MARSIHESRDLKQARPMGQDVDLLRRAALATPSSWALYHKFGGLSRLVGKRFAPIFDLRGHLGEKLLKSIANYGILTADEYVKRKSI